MRTLFIFSLFISALTSAQNLIPNPGFEEYVECPGAFSGNGDVDLAEPWQGFSADYLHECAGESDLSPEGDYSSPRNGDGYIRIGCYTTTSYNTREYIEVQLTEPLEIGEHYCVEYYCKLYGAWGIGTDGMGAFFTEEYAEYNEFVIFEEGVGNKIIAEAQIISPVIHSDTLNYTQVWGGFIADKAYNYVTIGNFVNDNKLETENVRNPLPDWGGGASYAIDDIAVWKCPVTIEEETLTTPMIYPTANGLHIKHIKEAVIIEVYNLQGSLLAQKQFGGDTFWNLSTLPSGMYVYKLSDAFGNIETGKITLHQ